MIVEYNKKKFPHQLINWMPSVEACEFALKAFRDDPDVDCTILETFRGFAVFTTGKFQTNQKVVSKGIYRKKGGRIGAFVELAENEG